MFSPRPSQAARGRFHPDRTDHGDHSPGHPGGLHAAVGYRDAVQATLEYARKSAVAQRRNRRVTLADNKLMLSIDDVGPETAGAGTFPRNLDLPTPDRHCGGATHQLCAPPNVTLTVAAETGRVY